MYGKMAVKPELTIRYGIASFTPELTGLCVDPPKRFPWNRVYHYAKETLIWIAFLALIFLNAVISVNNPHVQTRVMTIPIIIHR
jgi:hypothetical protein